MHQSFLPVIVPPKSFTRLPAPILTLDPYQARAQRLLALMLLSLLTSTRTELDGRTQAGRPTNSERPVPRRHGKGQPVRPARSC